MDEKQRTLRQNSALHLYFKELADELNSVGLDMKKTLKPEIEILWTPESIKEYLWKPVMEAMYIKKSTTELSTKEMTKVYEVLDKHLGEKHGVHVEFPSEEEQMIRSIFNS